jgi:hypothetical protein
MRLGHESRPYNADNAEQQASSPQGPEVTCEGMSFGFRIRGPPEEQAHLVLHAFVFVAIMDRVTRAASRCCAHCTVHDRAVYDRAIL